MYDLGDGKVEKVYRTQSDADAALPEYEKAMKNNPSNVVKVYSVDKKKKSVVMEKLDTEKGLRAMDAYINVVFRYNGTDDKVDQYFEKVMESDASFTKIFNGFKTSIAADKGMSAEEKKTSLWVINSLIKVKEQTGEMSDWIPENFGVDSKGTLKKFDLN